MSESFFSLDSIFSQESLAIWIGLTALSLVANRIGYTFKNLEGFVERSPRNIATLGMTLIKWVGVVAFVYYSLSTLAAVFIMPFGADLIIKYAYSLQGVETRYFLIDASVQELEVNLRWILLSFFVISFAIGLAQALSSLPTVRNIIVGALGIGFFATAVYQAYVVIDFWNEYGTAILYASIYRTDWHSVVAQIVLSPLYVLVLNIFVGVLLFFVAFFFGFVRGANSSSADNENAPSATSAISSRTVALLRSFPPGALLSFTVTIIAIQIGLGLGGNSIVATPNLLLWNALFDGATLGVTIYFLTKILQSDLAPVQTTIYVCLDILAAALLAIFSLYFGLLGTANEVDARQAAYLLFGFNAEGDGFDFGPRFWIMHTTFIPTVLYIAFLYFALLMRLAYVLLRMLAAVVPFGEALLQTALREVLQSLIATLVNASISFTAILAAYREGIGDNVLAYVVLVTQVVLPPAIAIVNAVGAVVNYLLSFL